jgi:hypothetical protein
VLRRKSTAKRGICDFRYWNSPVKRHCECLGSELGVKSVLSFRFLRPPLNFPILTAIGVVSPLHPLRNAEKLLQSGKPLQLDHGRRFRCPKQLSRLRGWTVKCRACAHCSDLSWHG